uniref:Ig-like domain-containing protein n=1 Tax=Oreochromis niloticus TaxID=8128 RepID=I3KI98_ORENI
MFSSQHHKQAKPNTQFMMTPTSTLKSNSCCDTVTKVQSYEGHSESVSCRYESQYQNSLKYICRGNRPSTCLQQALITSDTKQNARFRLDDDKVSGTFTVTINSLTRNDSGSYLCGVQRNSELDVFSAVELEVEGKKSYSFTVRITELEAADGGTYWCGSDSQWRVENYTKIELSGMLDSFV